MKTVLKIKKDETLQWKGIAICCVVLGHMNILPCGGAIGVGIFLVLSGYGIHQSYLEKNFEHYWVNKIKKVWIPYVIWETFVFMFYYITGLKRFTDVSPWNILNSILGIFSYNAIDKTMWYITYIFIEYFVFWMVFKRVNKINGVFWFTVISLFISGVGCLGFFPRYTGVWLYAFTMPIGVLYSWAVNESIKWSKWCNIIFMGLILWKFVNENVLLYIGFVTVVAMCIITLHNDEIYIYSKILKIIGKNSFFIYLCEAVAGDVIGTLLPNIAELYKK